MIKYLAMAFAAIVLSVAVAPKAFAYDEYPTVLIVPDNTGDVVGQIHFEAGISVAHSQPAKYETILEWNLNWCVTTIDPLPDDWNRAGLLPNRSTLGVIGRLYSHLPSETVRNFSMGQIEEVYSKEKGRCRRLEEWGYEHRSWGRPYN